MKPPITTGLRVLFPLLFLFLFSHTSIGQGNSLDFDGTDDYVDIGSPGLTSGTVELWLNADDVNYNRRIYSQLNGGTATEGALGIEIDNDTNYGIFVWAPSTGGWKKIIDMGGVNWSGAWHHLAVVYDGTNATAYWDGVEQLTVAALFNFGTEDLGISGLYDGAHGEEFNGKIDEFRIWSDARTQEEIVENMFNTLGGSETGLSNYYNFNATSGTTLTDQAGSNNGSLTNMAGSEWTAATWNLFTANAAIIQEGGSDVSTGTSDELTLTDVSFLNDNGDFLLAGHEGSAFSEVTTDLPAGSVVSTRYNRNWHLIKNDEAGTSNGDVTLSFDLGAAPATNNSYYLLTRGSTSGNFSVVSTIGEANGNSIEFTIDASLITDGNYYTVGRASTAALINEVVTDPQQDWSSGDFYNSSPGGSPSAATDEWVELYILTDGVDLTGWTIELNDGTDVTGDLTARDDTGTGAFQISNYLSTSGGSFTNTKSGDYLVLGNVAGTSVMSNAITINLKNSSGEIIDQVIISGSSGTGFDGNATDTSDESISRIPGETDSNDHDEDWEKTVATLGGTNTTSGSVLINEVVARAQQDWTSIGFSGAAPGGTGGGDDEWIELYIEDSGINLAGWTIEVNDGSDFSGDLTSSGAFTVVNYVGSGSFGSTVAGDYLVLGNPVSTNSMDETQDIQIILRNPSGTIIDQVTLGADAGEAPQGASIDETDESVSRYTNATDTNTDDADFIQTIATIGANNSVTGTVLINEAVANPQQDWSTNSFSGIIGSGTIDVEDEWVELYIGTAGLNLTNWNISITAGTGGTAFSGDLTATGAFESTNYVGSGTFLSTAVGDYLVLGNPSGSGVMADDSQITLTDAYGTTIDQTTLGQAAPTGISDESVARIPNATDTNVDANDFAQAEATLGAENFVNPLPSPGYGLAFDGTNDYITIPDSDNSLDLTNTYSIEAWIYVTDQGDNTIIDKGDYNYLFMTHPGVVGNTLGLYNNSMGWKFATGGSISTLTWTHVAVTFDTGADAAKFYVNGELIGSSGTISNPTLDNGDINIGRQQPSGCVCNHFDGSMDEVRIWSDVRTQEEILENMFTTLSGSETGLISYYNFDQSSGTTLPDVAGSNDGMLTNMAGTEWTLAGWDTYVENATIVQSGGTDVTTGTSDELTITDVSFLNDNDDFILIGHENSDFTEVTTDIPAPAGGTLVTARYDRSWHVTKNDAVGTANGNVTFTFDIGATPNANYTYYLLERTGTSGAFSIVPVAGVNPSGNSMVFTVNASQIDDGSYYTLGRSDAGVGNALDFDGTNDYAVVPDDNSLDITNNFTVSFWFKAGSTSQTNTYLLNKNNRYAILYEYVNDQIEFYAAFYTGTDPRAGSQMTLLDTEWHQIVYTYDGTTLKGYMDGVLQVSVSKTFTLATVTDPLHIGAANPTDGAYVDAAFDEIRIWDDARTQEEIIDNMFSNLGGDEDNLVAYYRMNQGIGDGNTALPDLSGNGNGGTLTNFDNLGAATVSSNYITSDRSVFSDIAFIVNTDVDVLTDASGELTITSTATAGDYLQDTNDQVIWGHDGGAFTEVATDLPTGTLLTNRMTKTWFVDKNDVVGTANGNLTFSFDLGTTPNPDYTYYLLERTGTSGDFSVVEVIGSEPNGNSIEFTVDGAQVTDENYFTLGRSDSGPGNALDFDGDQDYVAINSTGLNFTSSFTIEMWVKPEAFTGDVLFPVFNYQYLWAHMEAGGDMRVRLDHDGPGATSTSVTTVSFGWTLDEWQHLTMSFDGTDFRIYRNGKITDIINYPGSFSFPENWVLGLHDVGGSENYDFDGHLDEVRFWNTTRTATEIEQNMHRSLDVASATGLVAYYKFDQGDADGTNTGVDLLTDHSGNDNSGDLTNFGLSSTASNWVTSEAVVYDAASNQALIGAGNALDFDGTDDHVAVSHAASLDFSTAMTIEAWVRPTATGAYQGIVCRGSSTNSENVFILETSNTNQYRFYIYQTDLTVVDVINPSTFTTSAWAHVAAVVDGTDLRLYVNGVLTDSDVSDGTINLETTPLYIGRYRGDTFGQFTGNIDEVRIWNTARTATQIQDNMFEELVGNETGLVAYYRFDEVAGSTSLPDESTNSNSGTLTNMTPASDWVTAAAREPFKTTGATNWNSTTTWKDNAVPNATTADLNLGHDVTLDLNADVDDLNINSGVTLTLNSSQTLTVNGNLINNGTITGDGTLSLASGTPIITGGTISNLSLASGSNPTLQGATTVSGTLTLTDANLELDEFDLTVSGSISGAGSGSYIQTLNQNSSGGYLRMSVANGGGPVVFPIGTSNYTPFTMTNLGTTSSFGVRVFDGTYTRGNFGTLIAGGEEVDKTWDVDASGSGFNTTITIQWNLGDEGASFDRANMFLSKNRDDGWWRPITGTIAASGSNPYTASASGLIGFSQIGGGSGSSPLPVELTEFSASLVDHRVELNWTTSSELNNDFFEVQCSHDGENFMVIGTVEGHGDSDELINYGFTDKKPNAGMNYYRLRQVDHDGGFEYSPVRVVHVAPVVEQELNVFPNPSKGGFTLLLNHVDSPEVRLSLVDFSGKVIRQSTFDTSGPSLQIEFGKDLEPGLYVLMAETSDGTFVSRIVKE